MSTSEQNVTRHDPLDEHAPAEGDYAAPEQRGPADDPMLDRRDEGLRDDGVRDDGLTDEGLTDGSAPYRGDQSDVDPMAAEARETGETRRTATDADRTDRVDDPATGSVRDDARAGDLVGDDRVAEGAESTFASDADTTAGTASGSATGTADERAPLVAPDRAESYGSRWNEVKGMFVDEPRQAVQKADALVGELLDELEKAFKDQRRGLEQGLDHDDTSTEDLRVALRRYRSFFDRLLSL